MTMKYLPIQGTESWFWGVTGEWWQSGSPFVQFMASEGFDILNPNRPFLWSTDLNGHKGWMRWFRGVFGTTDTDHKDWQAGGASLLYYLDGGGMSCAVPYIDRNIIAHSHGLQVVLYACVMGLNIRRLISVGSPIRKDLADEMSVARDHIGYWLHLHDESDDRIQLAGEFGDGHLGAVRVANYANYNVGIASVGHSNLIRNPNSFHIWKELFLLDYFRMSYEQLKAR